MDTITTIATVPAVLALVTLAKSLGLPTKFSPLLAVLLGVALTLFSSLALAESVNWYQSISMGLILGLSASGLYDGAKLIGNQTASTSSEEAAVSSSAKHAAQ